jgi:hypothetical protein
VEPSSVAAFPTRKLVQANPELIVSIKATKKRVFFIMFFIIFFWRPQRYDINTKQKESKQKEE